MATNFRRNVMCRIITSRRNSLTEMRWIRRRSSDESENEYTERHVICKMEEAVKSSVRHWGGGGWAVETKCFASELVVNYAWVVYEYDRHWPYSEMLFCFAGLLNRVCIRKYKLEPILAERGHPYNANCVGHPSCATQPTTLTKIKSKSSHHRTAVKLLIGTQERKWRRKWLYALSD